MTFRLLSLKLVTSFLPNFKFVNKIYKNPFDLLIQFDQKYIPEIQLLRADLIHPGGHENEEHSNYLSDFSLNDKWINIWVLTLCFVDGKCLSGIEKILVVFLPPPNNVPSPGQLPTSSVNSIVVILLVPPEALAGLPEFFHSSPWPPPNLSRPNFCLKQYYETISTQLTTHILSSTSDLETHPPSHKYQVITCDLWRTACGETARTCLFC